MSPVDHEWAKEQIPAHLAGGLVAEDRARLEAHILTCAECIAEIDATRRFERSMDQLFAPVRPPVGLEDRVIRSLRSKPGRKPLGLIGRILLSSAAVVAVGCLGFMFSETENPTWLLDGVSKRPPPSPASLNSIVTAQADFRADARDGNKAQQFWSRDVAGLYPDGAPGEKLQADQEVFVRQLEKQIDKDGTALGWRFWSDNGYGDKANSRLQTADELARGESSKVLGNFDGYLQLGANSIRGAVLEDLAEGKEKELAGESGKQRHYGLITKGAPTEGVPSPAPAARPASPPPDDPKSNLRVLEEERRNLSITGIAVDALNAAPGVDLPALKFAGAEQEKGKRESFFYRDTAPPAAPAKPQYFKPGEAVAKVEPPRPDKPAPAPKPDPARQQEPSQRGPGTSPPPPPQQQPQAQQRKIIRTGEMEFEIENFDTAVTTLEKIVKEESGYIGTVNSERLPNGKVRGTVILRCPPDRLDYLVPKLRALGDLKSQRIASQDVTKQYTDLESRLRAARTMEERLIQIIKEGKGEIKDLLLAEKELGEWRTKIELYEGEKRYYDSQISLSTLTITLFEKEIRAPFGVTQTEKVQMGIEVEDVEKAHKDALQAVAEAKGRVTHSELKQLAAGQFNALVRFEVTPDASGPLCDRLKQLGTVARLDVNRITETEGGTGRVGEVKTTLKDSQFEVSLYNLANVQPRETVHLNLACQDAEEAYKTVLARVNEAGGRIVTSNLNRQKSDQTVGTLQFEIKTAQADIVLEAVKTTGEVMRLQVTENPDAQNVTRAKRGFNVVLLSPGLTQSRESTVVALAAENVSAAYTALLDAVRGANGRILSAQLNENDPANLNGLLDFEVRRGPDHEAKVLAALQAAGEIYSRVGTRAQDSENVVDSKTRIQISVVSLARIAPRETTRLELAVKDVASSYGALLEAVRKAKGWVLTSQLNEGDRRNIVGSIGFDIRRDQEGAMRAEMASAGFVYSRNSTRVPETQNAVDSKVRYQLTLFSQTKVPPRETVTMAVEVRNVKAAVKTLEGIVAAQGGRTLHSNHSREGSGRDVSALLIDLPLAKSAGAVEQVMELGHLRLHKVTPNPQAPESELAIARFDVTLSNELIVASDEGPWANIKKGFAVSLKAGSFALMFLMIGVCLILPLGLAAWGGWKVYRKVRPKAAPAP